MKKLKLDEKVFVIFLAIRTDTAPLAVYSSTTVYVYNSLHVALLFLTFRWSRFRRYVPAQKFCAKSKVTFIWPWWPSGLECATNSSRRFLQAPVRIPLGIMISIIQNWKQFLTIKIAGRRVAK